MSIKTIADLDLQSRRVFIRVDFNVPLTPARGIADATRIKEALPTIKLAIERGARVVLASHLGRPKGKPNPEFSLLPVAAYLAEVLGREVVLTDEPARAARSTMNFLWTTFTRFEPAADIHAAGTRALRNHLSYTGPILIDARMKPWYPKEVSCRPDVAETVTRRWREYFPDGRVEMGDSERGHLD